MENSMQDIFAFDDATPHLILPEAGLKHADILKELRGLRASEKEEFDQRGTTFVGNYTNDHEVAQLQIDVFRETMKTNGLYLTEYKSVRKAESEICSMVVNMLNGSDECCGSMTSGGTESLLMAIKTYRDYARKSLRKKGRLNFVVPDTAHCAYEKAAKYFDVDIRCVPTMDGVVQLKDIKKYVNRKTICVGLSAPAYPHGILDPIEEVAEFCLMKGIPCHVDNCLGGFIMSFLDDLPPWDFRVKGVTSISCDVHKYGGSIKGCSVIAYRTKLLRRHQYYIADSWSGGIAFTTAMQGSKNGALAAIAWATMLTNGKLGYQKQARAVQRAFLRLKAGLTAMPEIELIGDPASIVIAFRLRGGLDEYQLADCLGKKGNQLLARLQFPKCVHIMVCNRLLWGDDMVQDLLSIIRSGIDEIIEFPDRYASSAAMYGSAATIPNRNLVGSCVEALVDSFLSPQKKLEAATH